ncbi:MAG: IS200/IS605 family transposase [Cyanosarcina radialis HA8281-LM2]|jgi:putative transposase|nr:IS200/IS605 family transposase [Cyanosarcina radialis HA8281-LM2]
MALWRLYYHLIWATKERQPLIKLEFKAPLYNYIIGKADVKGCIVHAIGGIEDHVHLVVSIPPHISIADFVKNIKGSSAYYLNSNFLSPNSNKFAWQEGYGVFSLGSKQLDRAVAYVQNQKKHHLERTEIASLEQITHQDDPPKRWHQT